MLKPVADRFERPLRDLRISVTDRCNFRCPYCMPAEIFGERYEFLPRGEILSFEEIIRLVRVMAPLGVEKVRITGGEPLLRHDLHDLIGGMSQISGIRDLALTTNGSLLKRTAGQLKREGLSRMTVSLDTLDPEIFLQLNGEKLSVETVLGGIQAAREAGFDPIKINCVVQKGVNDHGLIDLVHYCREGGHILRFIEYMDVGTRNDWSLDRVLPAEEILALIHRELPIRPLEPNYLGEVARRWAFCDGEGEIGIIASVSKPFCGDCSRGRLTTDGRLMTCLFATDGVDLRTPLRAGASDLELTEVIRGIWSRREDRYSELRMALLSEEGQVPGRDKRVEMYQVGG